MPNRKIICLALALALAAACPGGLGDAKAQEVPPDVARRLQELERALKEQERVIAQNRSLLVRHQRNFVVHQEALQKQAQAIVQQQQQIRQSEQIIQQLREAIAAIAAGRQPTVPAPAGPAQGSVPSPPPPAAAPQQQGQPRATTQAPTGRAPAGSTDPSPEEQRAAPPGSEPQSPPRPPEVAAIPERAGVLTPRGTAIVETGVTYTLSSVNRVEIAGFSVLPAINIGSFNINEVDRRSVVATTGVRYGITNRWEAEVKVPFVHREDTTTSRPIGVGATSDMVVEATGSNIGDIELSSRYQFNEGLAGWPFLIGNFGVKTITGTDPFEVSSSPATSTKLATGTGFWSLSAGMSFLLPTDPVVLFGGLNYTYVVPRNVEGFGDVKPGDSIGLSLGFGFALNENFSFSLGTTYDVVLKTEIDGDVVPNSEVLEIGKATLGISYRLSDRMSLNLSIEQGITEDAPDVSYRLRVPVRYQLFD